ncbi:MAG TPA: SpvB/TcaC N-terminal domain-containing protein, partial [Turneriella sp.]|nr:SpvB/TcaC N-terminal domain-containing protein [Turneriella sp.]
MNKLAFLTIAIFTLFVDTLAATVNPDGSFSTSIPIETPAGRNGIQPKLALTYNSNAGNASASLSADSIVGIGWSVQGLPVITRINFSRGINYDGQDIYAGPEGRLIDVSTSAGAATGSIYHAENQNWTKYEPLGSDGQTLTQSNRCGDSACSWRATDRNGVVYFYGAAGSSRVTAVDAQGNAIHGGAVRVWALSRVTDLHGNYYEVEYYQNSGQFYPKKILYTGNVAAGLPPRYSVRFSYDETGRPDKEISY